MLLKQQIQVKNLSKDDLLDGFHNDSFTVVGTFNNTVVDELTSYTWN